MSQGQDIAELRAEVRELKSLVAGLQQVVSTGPARRIRLARVDGTFTDGAPNPIIFTNADGVDRSAASRVAARPVPDMMVFEMNGEWFYCKSAAAAASRTACAHTLADPVDVMTIDISGIVNGADAVVDWAGMLNKTHVVNRGADVGGSCVWSVDFPDVVTTSGFGLQVNSGETISSITMTFATTGGPPYALRVAMSAIHRGGNKSIIALESADSGTKFDADNPMTVDQPGAIVGQDIHAFWGDQFNHPATLDIVP